MKRVATTFTLLMRRSQQHRPCRGVSSSVKVKASEEEKMTRRRRRIREMQIFAKLR